MDYPGAVLQMEISQLNAGGTLATMILTGNEIRLPPKSLPLCSLGLDIDAMRQRLDAAILRETTLATESGNGSTLTQQGLQVRYLVDSLVDVLARASDTSKDVLGIIRDSHEL